MANFANVIKKFRDIFNIAADVKDAEINKVIQEADKLDIKQGLCGDTFVKVPAFLVEAWMAETSRIRLLRTMPIRSPLTWVMSLTKSSHCPQSCAIMPLHDTSRTLIRKAHPQDSRFPAIRHR